jgi:hypothetical protein
MDAELAYHPAALPLRAALGPRHSASPPVRVPAGTAVGRALDAYGRALADDPWLDAFPVLLSPVVPLPGADRWQVADAGSDDAIPVAGAAAAASLWRLAAVSGGHPLTVFGELGPTGIRPLAAWADGSPEPVAL